MDVDETGSQTVLLLKRAAYEAENPIATALREAFHLLEPQLRPPFPLTIPTQSEYQNLNRAILYGILCETHLSKIHIKHLHGIVTDGYSFFTATLTGLVNELYSKLTENVKIQLIRLTSEMVHVSAAGTGGLLAALLRQTRGGDFGESNLWLCSEMATLFLSKYDCLLEEDPCSLSSALYVFLRLLSDHCRVGSDSRMEVLKRKEIEFCTRVLREQFHLCLEIGRDSIRLLQDLVHVPEFREIWKDLLSAPSTFKTPGFLDISQLYLSRTPTRYFLLRIAPEMETQLRFLLTNVNLGSQTRYQIWFARKFVDSPERETVVVDIVRFICCAHHPSNKMILSNVIPRWAIVGWLLTICTKTHVQANVKLALFYDWLFFHEDVDNIMNVEPGGLLMVNSIPRYVDLTQNLLEFLFLLVDHYDVDRRSLVGKGVSSALDALVRKGVVQSFDGLIGCDMVSHFLKERLLKMLSSRKGRAFDALQPAVLPVF